MRRVAALYDIHGNIDALESVLAEIATLDVDLVVIGGDVVPGPFPRECLTRLLSLSIPTRFIRGNGETEIIGYAAGNESTRVPEAFREGMRWVARSIAADFAAVLSGWPLTTTVTIDGLGDTIFCHATPRNEFEIFTAQTPAERLRAVFDGVTANTVVCGHTHMAFDRTVHGRRVLNAGSVGMPFGAPGAHWLLLGPDARHRRTVYHLERAAAHVRTSDYPGAEMFASKSILAPSSAEEMQTLFERSAVTS